MIIKLPIIVSRTGDVRLTNRKPQPGKDEILATVHLDIPDSAFAPPALVLRATVVPAVSGGSAASIAPLASAPASNGRTLAEQDRSARLVASSTDVMGQRTAMLKSRTLLVDDGRPWTPERVRALMARLELDRDALALTVGVSNATVKRWETTGSVEASYRDELMTLEADAASVSR